MKAPTFQNPLHVPSFAALFGVVLSVTGALGQEEKKSAPPVAFPQLNDFSALWERSIFTTKDLPAPETPGQPSFADNLSLSGTYEIDGGVVAVLVDRTTSVVMEARVGTENEMGIKIRQVLPGASMDKTRIQLQKGDQAGWVTFADPGEPQLAEMVQKAVIPSRVPMAGAAVIAGGNLQDLQGREMMQAPLNGAAQMPGGLPARVEQRRRAPGPAALNGNLLIPPPSAAIPQAPVVNDVPLPPP